MISEVPAGSKITVLIKKGHSVAGISLGKEKTTVEINSQDAFQQFWTSKESEMKISGESTVAQPYIVLTIWSRSNHFSSATYDGYTQVCPFTNCTFQSVHSIPCVDLRPQSESVRASLQRLQEKMKEYSSLMSSSAQKNLDTALKLGGLAANVGSLDFTIALCSFFTSATHLPQLRSVLRPSCLKQVLLSRNFG